MSDQENTVNEVTKKKMPWWMVILIMMFAPLALITLRKGYSTRARILSLSFFGLVFCLPIYIYMTDPVEIEKRRLASEQRDIDKAKQAEKAAKLATKKNITPSKTASNNQQGDVKQQSPQFAKEGVYLKVINIKTVEDSDGYPQCKVSFRITNATKIKWKSAGVAIKAKVSNDKSLISDIPKWSSFSLEPGGKNDFSHTWDDPDEDLPCERVTAFNFAPSPSLDKRSVKGKKFKNNSEAYKHFSPLFAVDPTHNTTKFHPFKFNTKLSEYYGKKN